MRKYLKIVDDNKAGKGLRFANYLIDLIAYYILFFILIVIISFINPGFLDWLENIDPILDRLLSLSGYIVFITLSEILTKGRSIGKYITKTQVVKIDGTAPDLGTFLGRNLIRSLAVIDQLSFFGETGWHDSWSETRVVEKSKYEQALKSRDEISSIGSKEIV